MTLKYANIFVCAHSICNNPHKTHHYCSIVHTLGLLSIFMNSFLFFFPFPGISLPSLLLCVCMCVCDICGTSYVDKNKRRKEARTNLLGANMRRLLNLLACLALLVVGCIINGSTGLRDSLDDFELLPPSNPRETSSFQQHNYYIKIAWIPKDQSHMYAYSGVTSPNKKIDLHPDTTVSQKNRKEIQALFYFFEERNPFQLLCQKAAAADRSKSKFITTIKTTAKIYFSQTQILGN